MKTKDQSSKTKISRYFPKEIESKWQEKWKKDGLYKFEVSKNSKGKYYNLVELPYPSGDLHLGHWFAFVPPDAHARYMRMKGHSVFFPNGFDAFGLPAENAAINRGIHPKDWTFKNIETMRTQFEAMGAMIDWTKTAVTCLPDYYRWNQWIFLKMFDQGLAYRGKALSNWCPTDQTVLANEHIENGRCWRCGSEVIQKEVEQWFLKITDYADQLIWPDDPSVDWPKQVREGQNNWIGRSEGILIRFEILDNTRGPVSLHPRPTSSFASLTAGARRGSPALTTPRSSHKSSIINHQSFVDVFTTKPETADGATFLVIAPEHSFVISLLNSKSEDRNSKLEEIRNYVDEAKKKTEMERKEDRTKSGVFTGKYVLNPVTGKEIPVWISDYVLAGYGTGAIMAVPAADERDREFAVKFNLPIVKTSFKAKPEGEKKVNYHLRDWSISRQRYWGTPVPIVHCEKCGIVPVAFDQLPVELPYEVDYTPKGKPPLASAEEWLNVECPKCGGKAKRDAETLDTFFDSAWYYYRYTSPDYEKGPFDPEKAKELMPVDIYFGGGEHTLGHTLYARLFTKFFKDIGLVSFSEFAKRRVQHGIILGPDGNRMSKSRGNVVNPDDIVKEYGADTVRLYLSFMMPYAATAPWSPGAISGVYRFLKKVWDLYDKCQMSNVKGQMSSEDEFYMHKTIKKVGQDLEMIHFNTAVSALMEWLNYLTSKKSVSSLEYTTLLKLLAPFAPHITEELYQRFMIKDLGFKNGDEKPSAEADHKSIHLESWPEFDESKIKEAEVTIAVQVNGKLRGTVEVTNQESVNKDVVVEKAKADQNISKYLEDKQIKQTVYIPGKIINFVITE